MNIHQMILQTLQQDMMEILGFIFPVVAAMLTVYAVILAVNIARAEDESKRRQAKERIMKVFASIVIVLVLLAFVEFFDWGTPFFAD